MQKLSILALAATFALSTGLRADDEPKKKKGDKKGGVQLSAEDAFKKADKNEDGKLSLEELKEMLPEGKARDNAQKAFDRMDADHNGSVSLAEYKTFREEREKKGKGKKGKKPPADGDMPPAKAPEKKADKVG